MAYAILADVQVELGKLKDALSDTSNPSETDVANAILPDIAGEIDGVLSARGLTTPVTAPSDFVDRLKGLNALGAAARVIAALYPMAQGPQSTTFAQWLQDRYDAGLERLRRGEGIPSDVAISGALARSFWTSHPDYFASEHEGTPGNQTDPTFRRDTRW